MFQSMQSKLGRRIVVVVVPVGWNSAIAQMALHVECAASDKTAAGRGLAHRIYFDSIVT
jgi:hypothetical protein